MNGYMVRILGAVAASMMLASCQPARQIKSVVRSDLFSIGYGLSENQMDLSAGEDDSIDIVMREGIFHILDGSGKKVMKLSSYGDLLALLYDPSRSPDLEIMKPATQEAGQQTKTGTQGRFAAPIHFVAPEKIAVDASQTIYVADRVANPSARIYDAQSASYCDRIVRRFGAQGLELPYLGQEGPGGSPFPYIISIDAMGNDTLCIVSGSESAILVHHFSKTGNLLSSLRLSRESLPLPVSLSELTAGVKGIRIHANVDKMLGSSAGETFEIALKIDYYKEYFDPESLAISREEFAGSWIFTLDGANGRTLRSLAIVAENTDAAIPELIGENSELYYLLSDMETTGTTAMAGKAALNQGSSRMLQLMDKNGKVQLRYRIDLPKGVSEIAVLKVSSAGQIYALLKADENIRLVWWSYR
ncbi:MAG: hypothetical protein WC820_07735 [Spirochaetales bacterium]